MDMYIYDAVRSPRGKSKPNGGLAALTPHELVRQLIAALAERNGDQVATEAASLTLGCVGQIGAQGGHLALVSRIHAELPPSVRALTINNFCVSGLTAIGLAAQDGLVSGDDRLRLAGGVEMMSRVPFMGDGAFYYDDPETARRLNYVPVVLSADLLATMEGFEKADLDRVTARSHQRAAAAWERGGLTEVIAMRDAEGEIALAHDECVRSSTTEDSLARMEPAFVEMGAQGFDKIMVDNAPGVDAIRHVHSVANCPPTCDGAGLSLIGSRAAGERMGLKPRARIKAMAEASADPTLQLTAGFAAMEQVLVKAGMTLSDFDRIEFMEAFAATPVKFERDYAPDLDRVNPDGGHLAMGHPMGATGAILTATMVSGLERDNGQFGLIVTHGGSGVGSAMIVERV
ncbi:acetyl-CoA C-acyltransferase [Oceanicaulis sp. LC35]|uniref:acetyl-CoA C-acyltransferase n=1 Tax=Oceanicaulis sp. LC35 TaxID=3349635 RepID=UPI003F8605C2